MSGFPTLFSPIRIGRVELRNRLVMSPMETGYATREGLPSERTIAYYEARARGGVGLVTLGACTVDARHREVPRTMDFGRDEVVEAHRSLVDRVHAAGARIQPQLVHPGPDGLAPYLSDLPNVGPSIVPSYLTGRPCRALDAEEIPAIVDQYRAAVARIRAAGYDGVEIHAAHGYMLLGSFLSPIRNRRDDAYEGRTPAGRSRLLVEVIRAVREEVGDALALTVRLSGYERTPGGRPIHDTVRIAPSLVRAGADAFHVSGGVIDPLTSQMVSGSHVGPAHNVAAAEAVARVVTVPVIAVGRIHDPALAERILAEGRADLVAMGRPLLADPDLPAKARSGRDREIRRCISCQSCIDSMEKGRMACAVNAFTGRETELVAERSARPRRVAVVGGGPAGLEAARLAARRGHAVRLYERAPRLGGALLAASIVHADNEPLLDFLVGDVRRCGVDVRLGVEVSAATLAAEPADVVVIATGGRLETPAVPGAELPHVLTGADLRGLLSGTGAGGLSRRLPCWGRWALDRIGRLAAAFAAPSRVRWLARVWLPLGRRVAVIGGDLAAVELAEFLAERRRRVTLVEPGSELAPEVGAKRRGEHMDRLDRLAVPVVSGLAVLGLEEAGVRLEGGRVVPVDDVVLAGGIRGDRELAEVLEERGVEVVAVGDCNGLALIAGAIEAGARVACRI